MSIELSGFTARCAGQKKFERMHREAGAERGYGATHGLYSFPFITDVPHNVEERPAGVNYVLKTMVEDLLQVKKNGPIVLLDIGGGAGLTWRELAFYFRDEIAKGQLAFVVSNLVPRDADDYLSNMAKIKYKGIPYENGKQLVRFIDSTFSDLGNQSITLPTGQVVKLRGNVDFVHEHYSLTTWSNVPELDILHAASLLSPVGMYLVSNNDIAYLHDEKRNVPERKNGVLNAHRVLQERHRLIKVTQVETGPFVMHNLAYTIFKKPSGPLIKG